MRHRVFKGAFEARQFELHGHRVIYRIAGSGPPVVLIHGMVNSSRHWEQVAMRLADVHTVVAPDLIGHGDSATPRGDYSLGAHAASIRDLLTGIGIDKATIVGHSLGGGVAMQFFYQFPQRTERLAGVERRARPRGEPAAHRGPAGGISTAFPGGPRPGAVRPRGRQHVAARPRVAAGQAPAGDRTRLGTPEGARCAGGVPADAARRDRRPRAAGQRPRQALPPRLDAYPGRVGQRDRTIPLAHGLATHEAVPGSRFEVLPRAAHFPHLEDPEGLADVLRDFLATTEPVHMSDKDWGTVIARRWVSNGTPLAPRD